MSDDLPIIVVIALLTGVSLAALIWCVSPLMKRRFAADVRWLEHAVWQFTPEPYDGRRHVGIFYAGWVLALVAMLVLLPVWPVAFVFAAFLWWVPKLVIGMRWEKRRKKIDLQLSGAVLQMASNVASGMTLSQAVERVAERIDEPIRTEFAVMSNYYRHGADLTSAVEEAKRRLMLPNFNLFASALLVNQKMGGNVVDTLERLGHSLSNIQKMKDEIYAATAEGRTNIKVLSVAPVLMLGIIALMDAEAVGMLFTTPVGWGVLGGCGALSGAGVLWAFRIINASV